MSNGINDDDIDGRAINVDFFKQSIKRLQKRLAKKVKFSSNWRKLKDKINRLYTKIANIRHNALHKATSKLSTKSRPYEGKATP